MQAPSPTSGESRAELILLLSYHGSTSTPPAPTRGPQDWGAPPSWGPQENTL